METLNIVLITFTRMNISNSIMNKIKSNNICFRAGRSSDKKELKIIWKKVFHDEKSFTDWFFNERFMPEFCTVGVLDGKVVTVLHSKPISIRIDGNAYESILISGVATLPKYRNRGYMRMLMNFHLKRMKAKGYKIAMLKTVDPKIYSALGFQIVNNSLIAKIKGLDKNLSWKITDIESNMHELFECYKEFEKRYNFIQIRSYEDFVLKCHDYMSCKAKCLIIKKLDKVLSYCIFFENKKSIYGEECVGISQAAYNDLFSSLMHITKKEIKLRLAPKVDAYGFDCEITYGNSAYPLDIPDLNNYIDWDANYTIDEY